MNYDEFYPLLKSLFDKKDCGIEPNDDNFNVYLATRYITFYHPSLCRAMNDTINKYKINSRFNKPEDGYKFLKAILPKLPYKFIKYEKKQSVKNIRNKNITDEEIKKYADYLEISQREIRNLFLNQQN